VVGAVALATIAMLIAAMVGLGIGSRWGQRRLVFSPGNGNRSFVPTPSADGGSGATSAQVSSVADQVDPGVVDIYTNLAYQNAAAAGTGMVLTSSGEVLTNNHVIDGATSIRVQPVNGGRSYTARVVGEDPADDVAVLQLEDASGLKTVKIGDSSKLAVGQQVVAIGNAGGVGGAPSVVTGTIEALDQTITASDEGGGNAERLTGLVETNAPLQPGDSGGPLANLSGEVIGMDTAASANNRFESAADIGFAIPIAKALSVARQIESGKGGGGIVIGLPGFLGVEVQNTGQSGTTAPGAVVAGIVPGSPAQSVGIRDGDVITAVNGTAVTSAEGLTSTMRAHHPGDRVQLRWTDGSGRSHTATVTLTTGPAA
jgi:S1-C subfamily serine protease